MAQPLLFSNQNFVSYISTIRNTVRTAIAALQLDDFASAEPEAIAAQLYESNALASITIDTENITQHYPQEIKLDVPDSTTNSGQRLADGRRFSFNIPFTGDPELLTITPTTAGTAPFGKVDGNIIHFQLEQVADGNIEDIISDYQTNKACIAACATQLGQNIEVFNASLQQQITNLVTARKALLDKNLADAELIGVPIAA